MSSKPSDFGRAAVLAAAAALAFALGAPVAADLEIATASPQATVESLHRGLVAIAASVPADQLEARYTALEPLIRATHDLPYVAEFALRRQWANLTAAERERYVAAFERLSIMTYASRFKNVGAETFRPLEVKDDESGRAQVSTAIARASDRDIPLEYLLQQHDGEWRIINIVADGVSDLALKRAEYQRVLAGGTVDDLIRYIEDQTARLERP
jgi:phospholipid transport system substrate-binding protein